MQGYVLPYLELESETVYGTLTYEHFSFCLTDGANYMIFDILECVTSNTIIH